MSIKGIMPIKLQNERLPGKNIKVLGNKPLLQYELDNLLATKLIDDLYVYCSDLSIQSYLPAGTILLQRPSYLDLPTSNFTQIFEAFMDIIDADIYVYAHATAPFITIESMESCIQAVSSGYYDSAFCASRIQDYLWKGGSPLNFNAENLPRSQDIDPIYRETSGIYVFQKEIFQKYRRRIGFNPYIREVSYKEAVDINNPEDFALAEALVHIDL